MKFLLALLLCAATLFANGDTDMPNLQQCASLRTAYDTAVAEHGAGSPEASDAYSAYIAAGCPVFDRDSGGTSPPPHGNVH